MKIRVGIAAAAGALMLAACSSSGDGGGDNTSTPPAPNTTAVSSPAETSPAETSPADTTTGAGTANPENAAYCQKLSKWDETLNTLTNTVTSGDAAGLKALVPQLSAYVQQLNSGVPAELKKPIAQVKAAADELVSDAGAGTLDPTKLTTKFAAVVPAFTAVSTWKSTNCGS